MKLIGLAEAPALNARLRAVDCDTVIGFPVTDDRSVFRLGAGHGLHLPRLIQPADQDDIVFPDATEPTIFAGDYVVAKWHMLPDEPSELTPNIAWMSTLARKHDLFATSFNRLMMTAEGQGWLLGFGREEVQPDEDFGDDVPAAEIYRIVAPENGNGIGFREAIGSGVDAAEAMRDAVIRLGRLGIEG